MHRLDSDNKDDLYDGPPLEDAAANDDDIVIEEDAGDKSSPRSRRRRRILRGTAALPSLVTLGNGIAGFAAIHLATKPLPPDMFAAGQDAAHGWVAANLVRAAWLIVFGMVCDALDGRLARMTSQTSQFGAELDSLCDAITFGVAPAILMLRAVQAELFPFVGELDILPRTAMLGRAVWMIAAIYASCAILRLARFNVENEDDLSAHMTFQGLPSPAAALSVISLVLLHSHVSEFADGFLSAKWIRDMLMWCMPGFTLASALLMVSRLPFPHIVNQLLYGKRSFGYVVFLVITILAIVVIGLKLILAIAASIFVLSGPVLWLCKSLFKRRSSSAEKA